MGQTLSLNVPAHDNSKRTKLDLLKDPNTIEDIEEGIALTEMQKLCSEATIGRVVDRKLRTVMPNEIRTCLLEERMMEIFRRRNLFGTHPAQEGETLEEIGESLDVTRERIRQSEAKGVKVMKNIIALLCAKKKGEHSDAPEEVQKYITYKKWLERGLRATEGYIVPQAKMPPSARSIMLDTETFDILIRTNFFLTMDSAPETHEQIAKSIGKTKTYISGQIRKAKEIINNLLELIPEDYLDEKIATEGAGDPFETFDEFQAHQRTALEKLRASIKTESPKEQATQSKLETAA